MRLGLWNRLAIVVGTLTLVIAPTWSVLSLNADAHDKQRATFEYCMKGTEKPELGLTPNYCSKLFREREPYMAGWSEWFYMFGFVLGAVLVVYPLIAGSVWIAKWVMRGRPE